MSRSRKKFPMFSQNPGSMKGWKQTSNRAYRSYCKTKLASHIANGKDFDEFILDDFDKYISWWDSPKDGFGWYHKKPLENQCEHEYLTWANRFGGTFRKQRTPDETGHSPRCACPDNEKAWPNSWYMKMLRKQEHSGRLTQLVECHPYKVEAKGSSPLAAI